MQPNVRDDIVCVCECVIYNELSECEASKQHDGMLKKKLN